MFSYLVDLPVNGKRKLGMFLFWKSSAVPLVHLEYDEKFEWNKWGSGFQLNLSEHFLKRKRNDH